MKTFEDYYNNLPKEKQIFKAAKHEVWKNALNEIYQHFIKHLYQTDTQNMVEIEGFVLQELEIGR